MANIPFLNNAYFSANVGIGIDIPVHKLHVENTVSSTWTTKFSNTIANSNDVYFNYNNGTTSYGMHINGGQGAAGHDISTASLFTVRGDGKVGIGTLSPDEELTVNGVISTTTSDYVPGTTGSRLLLDTPYSGDTHSYIQAQDSTGSNADLALQLYGGYVGIGTDSPSVKLEVEGHGIFNGSVVINENIESLRLGTTEASGGTYQTWWNASGRKGFFGFGATVNDTIYLVNEEDSTIQLGTNGRTDDFTVSAGGFVGIGANYPLYKLQVGDTTLGDGNIAMKASGTGADEGAKLTFNMDVAAGNGNSIIAQIVPISYDSLASNNNSLNFKVGTWNNNTDAGASKMSILANGKVGIGTTNPGQKLDVVGNIQGSDRLYLGVPGTNSSTNSIEIGEGRTGNGYAYMDLTGDATYTDYGLRIIRNNSGANTSSQIIHRGTGDFSITTAEGADILLIPNSGNVGIGTTGPDAKLVVKDDSNVVYDASAYQKTFIIEKKNTNGDDQFANIKFNVTGYEGQTTGEASIGVVQTSNANSGNLVFGTRNNGTRSEKMRITSGGDVGIGTTDPKAKLDVNNVFCVDSKEHTITNAFTTCLTVNLTSHTGCHVVITAFGDWGNHSSAAYRGEFFLQNGATIYNEPGIILRQDDNTSDGTDQIICQIVDPASTADPKDFQIQIRHTDTTSPTGFDAQLTYTVQGIFNSIT